MKFAPSDIVEPQNFDLMKNTSFMMISCKENHVFDGLEDELDW